MSALHVWYFCINWPVWCCIASAHSQLCFCHSKEKGNDLVLNQNKTSTFSQLGPLNYFTCCIKYRSKPSFQQVHWSLEIKLCVMLEGHTGILTSFDSNLNKVLQNPQKFHRMFTYTQIAVESSSESFPCRLCSAAQWWPGEPDHSSGCFDGPNPEKYLV